MRDLTAGGGCSGSVRGKPPMLILGAMMRKRVHVACGVRRSGRPFDPALQQMA